MHSADPAIVYLDVREPNEWNLGHIPGAIFIPRGNLESHVEATIPRGKRSSSTARAEIGLHLLRIRCSRWAMRTSHRCRRESSAGSTPAERWKSDTN